MFGLCALSGAGQTNDFGLWTSLSVRKKLPQKVRADLEFESRLNENLTALSNLFVDASFSRKVNDYMRIGINARYGSKRNRQFDFNTRLRTAVELNAAHTLGRWDLSLRSRVQTTGRFETGELREAEFRNSWRNKMSVETKLIKKTTGSLSGELFQSINPENTLKLTDWRAAFKINRKISKQQILTLGYLVQSEVNDNNPARDFVILTAWRYDFNAKKSKSKKAPTGQ
jgi:hypothetical protein